MDRRKIKRREKRSREWRRVGVGDEQMGRGGGRDSRAGRKEGAGTEGRDRGVGKDQGRREGVWEEG